MSVTQWEVLFWTLEKSSSFELKNKTKHEGLGFVSLFT